MKNIAIITNCPTNFKGYVQEHIDEKELYDQVISAFTESFGFRGEHPAVLAIYSKLKKAGKLWIYKKAYKDHYQE